MTTARRPRPARRRIKRFFFEKKKQKTFALAGIGTSRANARRSKSFLVTFFQKSNCLNQKIWHPTHHVIASAAKQSIS
jgi:hypothetical protein